MTVIASGLRRTFSRWSFLEAPNRRFFWRAVAADGSIGQEPANTFMSLRNAQPTRAARGNAHVEARAVYFLLLIGDRPFSGGNRGVCR